MSRNIKIIITFVFFLSSSYLYANCSKEDIDYYLEKGFSHDQVTKLCSSESKSKKNNNGVYLVPAFVGLGAPYWIPTSKGIITGLTRNSDWKDLVKATVESVAYQSYDLFESMRKDGLKAKVINKYFLGASWAYQLDLGVKFPILNITNCKRELKKNQYIRVNASKKDIFIFQE